jgi:hypothetical protein
VSKVHFRKPPGKPMPAPRQKANVARSRERSGIEHVFADQKHRLELLFRTIGIAKARAKIGLANIACNMRRLLFWETTAAQRSRPPARTLKRQTHSHERWP